MNPKAKTHHDEIKPMEEEAKKESRRNGAGLLGNGLGKAQSGCTPLTKLATTMCSLGAFLSLVLPIAALGLLIPFMSNLSPKLLFKINY